MARKSCESRKRASLRCWCSSKKRPLPEPPISAGCFLPSIDQFTSLILPRCGCKRISWIVAASNREATGLRRECVNLICALSYVAEEALDGIGGLKMSVHALRELVKRQGLLFLLSQASHRFWVALAVFGECSRSVGPRLPVCLVDPRCQRAQLEHHLALVWERHSRCCVAYATCQR